MCFTSTIYKKKLSFFSWALNIYELAVRTDSFQWSFCCFRVWFYKIVSIFVRDLDIWYVYLLRTTLLVISSFITFKWFKLCILRDNRVSILSSFWSILVPPSNEWSMWCMAWLDVIRPTMGLLMRAPMPLCPSESESKTIKTMHIAWNGVQFGSPQLTRNWAKSSSFDRPDNST